MKFVRESKNKEKTFNDNVGIPRSNDAVKHAIILIDVALWFVQSSRMKLKQHSDSKQTFKKFISTLSSMIVRATKLC